VAQGEREELRQIFAGKGLEGDELERLVGIIASHRSLWVETMLEDELGLPAAGPAAWRAGLSTFAAFVAVGL
jgi:hypothetical protein